MRVNGLRLVAPACHKRILRASKYGEHMGFIGLSGSEIFHLLPMIYWINILLFITGIGSLLYERITAE